MSLEAILTSLVIGAIAGTIAGFLMGSKGGLLRNIVIGIIGGFGGTWVFGLIGLHWSGILGAVGTSAIGSCILIVVGKLLLK
jgi:uncharacterized membrane protein YeaQ/YmgE (transglycosylase-associated protein family)